MTVKTMGSLHSEDFAEEQYGSLVKRSRLNAAPFNQQLSSNNHMFSVPPSQYNPLDEPSPLGLRLRKSPSLLDLIQMRLSEGGSVGVSVALGETTDSENKKEVKGFFSASSANDKLKASNFPGFLLRIGSWEYVSRYEGDLVAKCYFAKHKLVWEVLEGGLKSKIEIQWSDIMALKAEFPDNGPATLIITLARRPAFFRETNPQPRKHTMWQATTDFTDGQASINKIHSLQCPPGVLNKHYEKLIQCDMRLSILTRHPKIDVGPLYFGPEASIEENSEESKGSPISGFEDAAAQLSAFKFEHNHSVGKKVPKDIESPSSVMDGRISSEHDHGACENSESPKGPGLRPSMSMKDLVNHLQNHNSKQMTSGNLPSAKAMECQVTLEEIAQFLINDTQCSVGLDERSLMEKVDSLCSLLQDPVGQAKASCGLGSAENVCFDLVSDSSGATMETSEGSVEAGPTMPRRDSLGDFLLHLPNIASLPKFPNLLLGILEDDGISEDDGYR